MATSFRPSLTLTEIQTILEWLPPDSKDLRHKLSIFTLKAQHGITKASHIRTGRASLESQLGLEEDATMLILMNQFETDSSILSKTQFDRVQHHRYIHDMMDAEEESTYEDKQS